MKAMIVPRGIPIKFDFTVVAGAKGADWGELLESFAPSDGYIMMTSVVTYPLGCVIEESVKGNDIIIAEVSEGGGGALAGLQIGDRIRAITAMTIPRQV